MGAPLHFQAPDPVPRSREKGCVFHKSLPKVPYVADRQAQILFECAISSPLPDTLLAANHTLNGLLRSTDDQILAQQSIGDTITDALIRMPLQDVDRRVSAKGSPDISHLSPDSADFLASYSQMRLTEIASTKAELLWIGYSRCCAAYASLRGIRKALRVGLYFSDQCESPAESLLLARCAELGFQIPYLQVSVIHPGTDVLLGRVDGLWASPRIRKSLCYADSRYGRRIFLQKKGNSESIVIEFDGKSKYGENFQAELDRERLRQNAISNLGFRFVRIGWIDLMQPSRLDTILRTAGVPRKRRSSLRAADK
jgi:hypothetical protein